MAQRYVSLNSFTPARYAYDFNQARTGTDSVRLNCAMIEVYLILNTAILDYFLRLDVQVFSV